jgi:hypothetical protein
VSEIVSLSRCALIELFWKHGPLLNTSGEKIPYVKQGHGPCCTCQTCGHSHDECCCAHNACLDDINRVVELQAVPA